MNNQQQIENFKQYLIQRSKSLKTITSYISNLEQYFNQYSIINRENVISYKQSISHFKTSTILQKLSSLKQFNEYLLFAKEIDSIYVIKADFIKQQDKGNPTDVTVQEVQKFLKKVLTKETTYKSRNIAIIYLIANTGIRREECCNILLKNIDLDNGEMIVIGKGNKERTVLLNDKAINVIKNYLQDRKSQKHKDSKYLFISEKGNKLCPESINEIFNFYSTPKNKITPHDLRHNYCSWILENDIMKLHELKRQAGHCSISITDIYLHARKENMKKNINKACMGE